MTGLTNQHHSQAEDADVVETLNYLLENVEAKTALTEKMSAGRDTSMPSSAPNRGPDLTSASEEAEKNKARDRSMTEQPPQSDDPDVFKLKAIQFNSSKVSIVTQNLNGPCPLIALVNVLALKGLARLPASGHVTRDALTHLIADVLLQMRPDNMNSHVESNYNRNLDDVINLLPDLGRGLDVNVKFRHVTDFEFTPALSLFDLLRVNLYHGWIPDPQFVEIRDAVGDLTYNQLVEHICDETNTNRLLLEEFLMENVTQLTYQGLIGLMEAMKDGELAVLFRNNHFHTILRRKDLLYLLVSDSGYASEPSIVWESFNNVDGSSIFFASDFTVGSPRTSGGSSQQSQAAPSTDADFLLAQEMQACEEELARQEAEREARQNSTVEARQPPVSSEESRPHFENAHYKNPRPVMASPVSKDKKCTIS